METIVEVQVIWIMNIFVTGMLVGCILMYWRLTYLLEKKGWRFVNERSTYEKKDTP